MLAFLTLSLTLVFTCSIVADSAIPWAVALQAPLSMGCSRQEHWSGLPFPSLGSLPDQGIKPRFPALQVASLLFEVPGTPHTLTRSLQTPLGIHFLWFQQIDSDSLTGNRCIVLKLKGKVMHYLV